MKKICSLFLFLTLFTLLVAAPVSPERARQTAIRFVECYGRDTFKGPLPDVVDVTAQMPFSHFYTFTIGDAAFVMISSDDRVVPVLAYSFTHGVRYDSIPAHVAAWLNGYDEEIAFLCADDSATPDAVATQWKQIASGRPLTAKYRSSVAALLSTTWDQDPYYNMLCPGSGSGSDRAVTGCVATAVAQVMKYWNHPATGRGSHTYTDATYGSLSADFGNTTYDWNNMPNAISSASTSTQINAVATLMYHIGVAIEMEYGTANNGGSGAAMQNYGDINYPSAQMALVNYFRYQPTLYCAHKDDYNDAQWTELLRNELDQSRPIIYEGYDAEGGHCFVCDGYNTTGKFHFNWGWGGYYDGYYTMGALNLGGGGTGTTSSYTFNVYNNALLAVQPNNATSSTTTVNASANYSSYGSVSGTGNYVTFSDTVHLTANANTGYKFVRWSDGDPSNPRSFLAAGGTYSLVAEMTPIAGDTITYSTRSMESRLSTGSTTNWGIRIPNTSLQSGTQLTKVRLYVPSSGSYTLNVYLGTTNSATVTQTFSVSSSNTRSWYDVTLNSPLSIDGSQHLWVTFSSSASYPAAYSTYSGNADGILINTGGSWVSYANYGLQASWMIDAVFTDASQVVNYTINTVSNNSSWGYVTGGGTYPAGATVPITATPYSGYRFVQWNDGNTAASRSVVVTSNTTYTATFAASGSSNDCTVTSLPWSESFENGLSDCWTLIDADSDGKNWKVNSEGYSHTGSYSMESDSWTSDDHGFQADNYLVTPKIVIPTSGNTQLEFYVRSGNTSYPDDLAVLVSTGEGVTASEFSQVMPLTHIATSSMSRYTLPLTAYQGSAIRIAFRHYYYDGLCLFLDDVAVSSTGTVAIDPTQAPSLHIWNEGRTVVVNGAAGRPVSVCDVLGRKVADTPAADATHRFVMPHPGVYFVVADHMPAQRIVVL